MKTVKRISELGKAVDFARDSKTDVIVADIATDHGYLAEYLSKQSWVKRVIASDISQKCLDKVIKLIETNNLKNIETIVGDGLIPLEKVDISVIAGVGGWEIIKMLKNQNALANGNNKCDVFVLQPAQNVVELREWLFDNEFFVIKDYVIEDAERFYPIIIVDVSKKQINEKNVYNLWIGRDNLLESPDFVAYLKDTLTFLEFIDGLSENRIEQDKELKEKYELKLIIEKLLNK